MGHLPGLSESWGTRRASHLPQQRRADLQGTGSVDHLELRGTSLSRNTSLPSCLGFLRTHPTPHERIATAQAPGPGPSPAAPTLTPPPDPPPPTHTPVLASFLSLAGHLSISRTPGRSLCPLFSLSP